ncbi:hypothetical protein PN466_02730 [Roseofilum reptotaenium CS-1145]|nr:MULTISPECIES: hypothetical protein [Roseofilum]MBP0027631.1 hypothetical protein [Roseofilum sp. Guam]MDB9515875.1 hypothetical protein [Roseofilum reptotaenium CS-1145]
MSTKSLKVMAIAYPRKMSQTGIKISLQESNFGDKARYTPVGSVVD